MKQNVVKKFSTQFGRKLLSPYLWYPLIEVEILVAVYKSTRH